MAAFESAPAWVPSASVGFRRWVALALISWMSSVRVAAKTPDSVKSVVDCIRDRCKIGLKVARGWRFRPEGVTH